MNDRFAKSSEVGELENLQTTNKENLVEATNELENEVSQLRTDNITLSIYKVSNYATL